MSTRVEPLNDSDHAEHPPATGEFTAATGRILLAAGGTGGHIYPAVALAEAISVEAPRVDIQFVCGSRPAEWQIYRRLGIEPWILPVAHHRRGYIEGFRFIGQMLASWGEVRRRLRASPVQVAVGFGGYVSVPPLLAARLSGARIALHEQNVHPGVANRLLARLCRLVALGAPVPRGVFPAKRTKLVGNPIRADILQLPAREFARDFFRLAPGSRRVCLVIGGSQGAQGLNAMIIKLLGRLRNLENPAAGWQLLWSTGPDHFEAVSRTLRQMK